ncbi:hypothetical protein EV643_103441 [Kribbella sp. VKM Ac-2527]|uniref:Phage integrase family protein n=1 Tax=Kribbella caucasensis TaxID=2512215 RepID=A0A4V6PT71_9ACTN|nr:hypothetical protein [Kribbella sp. VKM Ac-2527]TDO51702.1 hypothetical protein EV643_103441 [Kribbella sp. VKM Ac-2527]
MQKINHLLDLWEKRFEGLVADGKRSPTSLDTYRRAMKNHLRPALGEIRIGVPIGEAMAVLWSQVDLDAGTVDITHTIVRVRGEGLLRKTTKSKAGQRVLSLTDWATAALRKRHAAGIRLDDPIFPDSLGGFRDPTHVRRSLRTTLSTVGSTARRDLGLTLRALRRETSMSRKQVAETPHRGQRRSGMR